MSVSFGAPSPQKNRTNFEVLVQWAADDGRPLLALEDDIDVSPDFADAVLAALDRSSPTVFWLCRPHNHPPAWEAAIKGKRPPPPTGFYTVRHRNLWFGTQAIFLPADLVATLATDPTFAIPNHQSFDRWLRDRLTGLVAALPNPVQHRSPTTLVDPARIPRISPTFHMPRDPADWRLACRTTAAT